MKLVIKGKKSFIKNNDCSIKSNLKGYLFILLACLIWSTDYTVYKIGVKSIPPFFLGASQYLIGSIFLLIVFKNKIKRSVKKVFWQCFGVSICLVIAFTLFLFGLKYISAIKSALIVNFDSLIIPIIYFIAFGKRAKANEVASIILASFGLIFINYNGLSFNVGIGEVITLVSAVFYALHAVLFWRLVQKYNATLVTIVQLFFSGIICLIISFFSEGNPLRELDFSQIEIILYVGIFISGLSWLFAAYGQKHMNIDYVGILYTLIPILGAIIANLVLGETLTLLAMLGGVIIIIALVTYNMDIFEVMKGNFNKQKEVKYHLNKTSTV